MPAQANERIITDDTAKEIIEALKNIPGVTGATTIDHGGTGATNKEDALRNLGAQPLIGVDVEKELGKMVKSVNSITPDASGNINVTHVRIAENLASDDAQDNYGEFIERATGGTASLTDGKSWIGVMEGNSVRSGFVPEQKSVQVTNVSRVPISAAINWTNFRIAVNFLSTNKIFSYDGTEWNEDPEDYGISVTGYPIVGDSIAASLIARSEAFNFVSDNPNLQVNISWPTYEAAYELNPITFFSYTSGEWSADMTAYGFTITGNPSDGDVINVSYTPEVHNMYVNPATRGEEVVAYVNWDTFKSAVQNQQSTVNIAYTTDWSESLIDYGISISGGPIKGDQITLYYSPEVPGTITNATPIGFVSMNWNLYRDNEGVARVLKYHPTYGFRIEGTYTGLTFSTTLDGEQSPVSIDSEGNFQIPSDGYVFVTGGNTTDTAVYMTWSDWTEGTPLPFEEHRQSTIDLASLMQSTFPYGLCAVGSYADTIDFANKIATSYIDRLENTSVNMELVKDSGREYAYDADYIYVVKETPTSVGFSLSYELDAWDHGMEWVVGTTVPVFIHMLYGQNLRDKLRTDVVTISQQSLTSAQKQQIRQNLGLGGSAELPIENGGTGANTAAGARTALGLGSAAVKNLAASIANTDTGLPTAALVSQAVDALNGKITQKNIGAFGSLSNIESALVTQLNSMTVGSSQEIFFTTTAYGISVFNVWSGYVGTIFKTDTNRCVVDVYPHGTEAKNIIGFYVNSAWTWSSLYDQISTFNFYDIPGSGASNNALKITLDSSTPGQEYKIFVFGIGVGNKTYFYTLYARQSTGLAVVQNVGTQNITASISGNVVTIKGDVYMALAAISNRPITITSATVS